MSNITYPIPTCHPKGRRLVIPDIHGCAATFLQLIEKIQLQKEDQLFLLGDYVDRGPDSGKVIDTILDLQQKGYHVFPLRGNHEEMLLDELAKFKGSDKRLLKSKNMSEMLLMRYVVGNNLKSMFDFETFDILPRFVEFMENLPYYFELEDYFLVHAGFDFFADDPLQDTYQMVWIRNFQADEEFLGGKQLIHGHTPTAIGHIMANIEQGASLIPLDNGCVFHGHRMGLGKLLCLNLDTQELIFQENIDQE